MADDKKDPVTQADVAAGSRDARGKAGGNITVDPKTGKAVPAKDFVPTAEDPAPKMEKAKPASPPVDLDADDPKLGVAERAARAKRRRAKAAGQAEVLK